MMRRKYFTPAIAASRKNNARLVIERKISALEKLLNQKTLGNTFFPRSIEQFRQWEDVGLGLDAIGSKSTLNTPENKRLKDRATTLIERLKRKSESENPSKSSLESLREKVRHLEFQVTALASDYHQTREELLVERKRRGQAERRIENLTEELRSLKKMTVIPTLKEG